MKKSNFILLNIHPHFKQISIIAATTFFKNWINYNEYCIRGNIKWNDNNLFFIWNRYLHFRICSPIKLSLSVNLNSNNLQLCRSYVLEYLNFILLCLSRWIRMSVNWAWMVYVSELEYFKSCSCLLPNLPTNSVKYIILIRKLRKII